MVRQLLPDEIPTHHVLIVVGLALILVAGLAWILA